VGRSTAANTDAQLSAEILSWSRSKGLFAGIALQGATLRPDQDVNKELYGSKLTSKDILMTDRKVPEEAKPLISVLNRYSRFEDKDKPIESRAKDAVTGDADRAKTKKQAAVPMAASVLRSPCIFGVGQPASSRRLCSPKPS
jgi:hypothetical protein